MIRQPARIVALWRYLDFERTRSWTIRKAFKALPKHLARRPTGQKIGH